MGRFRTLCPELLQALDVATMPDGVYRLFKGLYMQADDDGRCPASPAFLNGAIFWGAPRSIEEVASYRDELVRRGRIRVYSVAGAEYLEIVGWRTKGSDTYQVINKYRPSRLPAPDGSAPVAGPSDDGSAPCLNGMDPKGKRSEGEGNDPTPASLRVWESYASGWRQHYGCEPTRSGKEEKLLESLLAQHSADELIRRVGVLFGSGVKWPAEKDFATFARHCDLYARPAASTWTRPEHRSLDDTPRYRSIPIGSNGLSAAEQDAANPPPMPDYDKWIREAEETKDALATILAEDTTDTTGETE